MTQKQDFTASVNFSKDRLLIEADGKWLHCISEDNGYAIKSFLVCNIMHQKRELK
jgi:hypothetical protein